MTTRAKVMAALGLVAALALGVAVYAFPIYRTTTPELQGWIEAYFVFVSPDEVGRIETLSVREGDHVEVGTPLFALDADLQRATVAEREAAVTNAKINFDRAKELLKRAVGSQKVFDDAEAALRTAEAQLNSARTRLERRRIASPVTGSVQEIYFRVGEMVQSGRPILSLLPPGNTRVRFFVPQAMLPSLRIDQPITIRCDGCPPDLTARINFISAQAEFTPPVIYSQEERARLVFRVEALPDTPERLRVGQPVTVVAPAAGGLADARR
jgi:HlyD family secretion protein